MEQIENTGFARFGWALPDGSLMVGTDNKGYAFGVGPNCSPKRKVFNGEVEHYGEVGPNCFTFALRFLYFFLFFVSM